MVLHYISKLLKHTGVRSGHVILLQSGANQKIEPISVRTLGPPKPNWYLASSAEEIVGVMFARLTYLYTERLD